MHTRWQNHRRKRWGNPFRAFVHPVSVIHSLVLAAVFEIRRTGRTLVWKYSSAHGATSPERPWRSL
jgi:hypothetical protein